jgi:hypothetical protein
VQALHVVFYVVQALRTGVMQMHVNLYVLCVYLHVHLGCARVATLHLAGYAATVAALHLAL